MIKDNSSSKKVSKNTTSKKKVGNKSTKKVEKTPKKEVKQPWEWKISKNKSGERITTTRRGRQITHEECIKCFRRTHNWVHIDIAQLRAFAKSTGSTKQTKTLGKIVQLRKEIEDIFDDAFSS